MISRILDTSMVSSFIHTVFSQFISADHDLGVCASHNLMGFYLKLSDQESPFLKLPDCPHMEISQLVGDIVCVCRVHDGVDGDEKLWGMVIVIFWCFQSS